ncbi:MAG: DeoR/GlpR family DNA-binding transcription regulator [Oscillospiraceae bacterium]|nr:DeoR/GlpR family DNA-binding transcription regulator [Oscillospiraceae bacterium]
MKFGWQLAGPEQEEAMIREERLKRICDYLKSHEFASVEDLTGVLGVSKATVRRDLAFLDQGGELALVRGGATIQNGARGEELAYDEKRVAHSAEKARLGEAAAALVQDHSAVLVDAGTTTRAMIPFLKERTGLNLVTNDVAIAADLSSCRGINVTVTGGQLRQGYYTLSGYLAEDLVRNMRLDAAFIGFDAVDVRSGCYITNTDEVALKRCIIEAADRVVAVCDHAKFESTAFVSVCPLSQVDVVVTDRQLDPALVRELEKQGIQVVLA